MKPEIEINRDSLHYRLFHVYNSCDDLEPGFEQYPTRKSMNTCNYALGVAAGFFVALLVVAVGVILGTGLLQIVGTLISSLYYDTFMLFFIDQHNNMFVSLVNLVAIAEIGLAFGFAISQSTVWAMKRFYGAKKGETVSEARRRYHHGDVNFVPPPNEPSAIREWFDVKWAEFTNYVCRPVK